jgi:hypothetical protein
MPQEWVEVNIAAPSSREQRERLLVDVIDPLVHETFSDCVETWFYFWESEPKPQLRLRIQWQRPAEAEASRAELTSYLNTAEHEGRLAGWYEGCHGRRGETYNGEAADYGEEVWDLISKDWMSGSELALALVKFSAKGCLTKTVAFHWDRRVHLFSNQLLLDEKILCLLQARKYFQQDASDKHIANLLSAIDQYFMQQP